MNSHCFSVSEVVDKYDATLEDTLEKMPYSEEEWSPSIPNQPGIEMTFTVPGQINEMLLKVEKNKAYMLIHENIYREHMNN